MVRYTGAKLRVTRRLGDLPSFTKKRSNSIYLPGQHLQRKRFKKESEYAIRLQEKQKLRFNYGVTEKQLVNYAKKAKRVKGETGSTLLQFLEMRLDNIIYRLGMSPTIPSARQLVNHKHIVVNGKCVSIASYQCKPGDIITVRNSETSRSLITRFLKSNADVRVLRKSKSRLRRKAKPRLSPRSSRKARPRFNTRRPRKSRQSRIPEHLRFDRRSLTAEILDIIDRDRVAVRVKELSVVEFYSRKI